MGYYNPQGRRQVITKEELHKSLREHTFGVHVVDGPWSAHGSIGRCRASSAVPSWKACKTKFVWKELSRRGH